MATVILYRLYNILIKFWVIHNFMFLNLKINTFTISINTFTINTFIFTTFHRFHRVYLFLFLFRQAGLPQIIVTKLTPRGSKLCVSMYVHTCVCWPCEIESSLFRLSNPIIAPTCRILLVDAEKIL